ncbi:anti-sigma factor antagonist [Umezawaea tangerina]|uniref:Anti-sigma factor antagonist n=1 Tax=Umezawaea tangerina TaxID=84725 RepID=A0A2T0T577_9PSEU|nr:anti-sigma factor antagonist [Umezawaea tangerina]PRY40781.1 anti-anti-sigma factor [Umezawaea tangerina]
MRSLVVLGDSTSVGIGDPVPGGWRGFGPLLAASFTDYRNLAFPGARIGCVRTVQLADALSARPDAVVVLAGMNDTLRSDFDPVRLHDDLDHVVGALRAAGAAVVTVRFHDHSRVFRLPGPLRRALSDRIASLNAVVDTVVERHGIGCVDLDRLPGAYDPSTWSVDRLHPSELGHRRLAREFASLLGVADVSLECTGGVRITPLHHAAWLLVKGVPWLWRRGRDLFPLVVRIILASRDSEPIRCGRRSPRGLRSVWLSRQPRIAGTSRPVGAMVVEFSDVEAVARRISGCVVVEVGGELDMDTVPGVEGVARQVLADLDGPLVLDLTRVTFFGSTGLSMLLELRTACRDRGVPFRLVADSKTVLRPLELTDLLREFVIARDLDEAAAH